MDLGAIVGGLLALAGIIGAMLVEGANPMSVVLPGPLILVFGGTLGAGIASGLLKDALAAVKTIPSAITGKVPAPVDTIESLVALADKARREGLLALEKPASELADPFLRTGLRSAIDGTDPDDLRIVMEERINARRATDKVAASFFTALGGYAPTIGIIGTVVSLVHVLENLSEPNKLGPMISSAFVATLWGIASANIVWLPLGSRIKRLSEARLLSWEIGLEGMLAVQQGINPRLLRDRLTAMIPGATTDGDSA